jgi:hypothetical protein
MFLREKYEGGSFVKIKARLVAEGHMLDHTVYSDHLSPTAKIENYGNLINKLTHS